MSPNPESRIPNPTPFGPRYLVPFHPKRAPHQFADVLIIGSGLAGLRAASAVDPRLSALIVTKDSLRQSNSTYAQGGIASVTDPEDRFEDHVSDTLIAGADLCNERIVDLVVKEAPQRINELISWGTHFDQVAGHLALGREGGHSHERIIHANGDATGAEVMRAMTEHVRGLPNIDVLEDTFTLDLLTVDGACRGALVWREDRGLTLVWAKQTILCTGGVGQVYRETTNPRVATGDGHAMAFRAGAELRDMEFMQFHPTVLYIAGSSRMLITEATRGEGARLVDRNGYRFMPDYDPRAELAPRDVVSQAIQSQMAKTRHANVYLDMSHLDATRVRARFPHIAAKCAEFGIDIAEDPIPVRPGAHYMIGGLTVDDAGHTTLKNLWAAGEVASSGLHGANRLASNSLLEAMVFGARAGEGATAAAAAMPDDFRAAPLENAALAEEYEPLDLVDIRNSLSNLMVRNAGVRRDSDGLSEAVDAVTQWCGYVLARQFADPAGWELQNLLTVAHVMLASAQEREESRGVHFRSDFPAPRETWKRHITIRR
jgi:L-aspartate oxidase